VADIFVSYTLSDRDWAFWIGQQLEALGHTPHVHDWEISAGGDIVTWMEERHDKADNVLLVVSEAYLTKGYSKWERLAAQWAAAKARPNFALPVMIEDCKLPAPLAQIKRCDLYGIKEEAEARARLAEYLTPAAKPTGRIAFPPKAKVAKTTPSAGTVPFPGFKGAVSNIPIAVPLHFLGRDNELQSIDAALKGAKGDVVIAALHGLRGVGKTALAAAYAQRHRADYRATWWVRAQTESTTRADLISLGVRLGWIAVEEKEEPALAAVRERLRDEGEGLLLIYDSAVDASSLRPYLPPGGAARVLVTSNAPAWRGIAAPIEIRAWPQEVGADYLVARTERNTERTAAERLSEALGGLPLAHEQAAAYCERLDLSFVEYAKRLEAAPAQLLDADKDAPVRYHDRLTVAKSFSLAIDEAAKRHPASEPLIIHAARLAPEPIPLFLFSEAREVFGEPLASALLGDGLDEAVAALRAFALVDREAIADERDPSITTDALLLHRLVRTVAARRPSDEAAEAIRRVLVEAMVRVYPSGVYDDPGAWPRARRLDALALDLVGGSDPPSDAETPASHLLNVLGQYRIGALGAYSDARPLCERALAIREKALGPDHPDTAQSLNNLAFMLQVLGDPKAARHLFERALAIREKTLGFEHPETATSVNNLAALLQAQGDLNEARPLLERALTIREKTLGPEHRDTATSVNDLANLLRAQGDLDGARPFFWRALAIYEKVLGPEHFWTATSLNNLALLLQDQGDLAQAQPIFDRALRIRETTLGPEHPDTAESLNNLAALLQARGDLNDARPLFERAVKICEKTLGPNHPQTILVRSNLTNSRAPEGDPRAQLELKDVK
jgi:tetratricopeptide (TPR) repeat protein